MKLNVEIDLNDIEYAALQRAVGKDASQEKISAYVKEWLSESFMSDKKYMQEWTEELYGEDPEQNILNPN